MAKFKIIKPPKNLSKYLGHFGKESTLRAGHNTGGPGPGKIIAPLPLSEKHMELIRLQRERKRRLTEIRDRFLQQLREQERESEVLPTP